MTTIDVQGAPLTLLQLQLLDAGFTKNGKEGVVLFSEVLWHRALAVTIQIIAESYRTADLVKKLPWTSVQIDGCRWVCDPLVPRDEIWLAPRERRWDDHPADFERAVLVKLVNVGEGWWSPPPSNP